VERQLRFQLASVIWAQGRVVEQSLPNELIVIRKQTTRCLLIEPGIAGCLAPDEPIRIVRKCQQRVLVCDRVASNGTSHVRTRVLSQPRQYSNRRAVMSGGVFTDSGIGAVGPTCRTLSPVTR